MHYITAQGRDVLPHTGLERKTLFSSYSTKSAVRSASFSFTFIERSPGIWRIPQGSRAGARCACACAHGRCDYAVYKRQAGELLATLLMHALHASLVADARMPLTYATLASASADCPAFQAPCQGRGEPGALTSYPQEDGRHTPGALRYGRALQMCVL